MRPHIQRLGDLQESVQRLPTLIQAVMVKEKSKRILPGSFKCVERLSSDIENLEDRIEALNEIMEVQRQRVNWFLYNLSYLCKIILFNLFLQLTKSGVDLKMVVLPPDITTSLTAFGSAEAINSLPRREQVIRKCLIQQSIFNLFTLLVFLKNKRKTPPSRSASWIPTDSPSMMKPSRRQSNIWMKWRDCLTMTLPTPVP